MSQIAATLYAVIVVIASAAAYAALSLLDLAPMSIPILSAWLASLVLTNLALVYLLWRKRAYLSLTKKMLGVLWGVIALWYWLPAPIYYLLTMNLDTLQLKWTAFAYFWEVPVVGGLFLVLAVALFKPARNLMDRKLVPADPAADYRWTLRHPVVMAALIVVFTILGYAIGALQIHFLGLLPTIEAFKNLVHGITISLFVAVFFYLSLSALLEPVRAQIASKYGPQAGVGPTTEQRIFGMSLTVMLGTIALASLFVLQAAQHIMGDYAAEDLQQRTTALAQSGRTAAVPSTLPGPGAPASLTLLLPGQELDPGAFSPETQQLIATHDQGTVRDTRRDLKMVSWASLPGSVGKVVSYTLLTYSYGPLTQRAGGLAIAAAFVLTLTVGILTYASRAVTQALRSLTNGVRQIDSGQADE
ncbi:MAG TPA: hypothetical protein VGK54_10685, partial [Chloroflexota bacterium]